LFWEEDDSDHLQILAYACLLELALGIPIAEGRIRYHADNVLVHVPLDDAGRQMGKDVIQRARELRHSTYRPPVTENESFDTRQGSIQWRIAQYGALTQPELCLALATRPH
jgi:CRISPR/Cas system-associated exonuclease Cas4 (RecB family)